METQQISFIKRMGVSFIDFTAVFFIYTIISFCVSWYTFLLFVPSFFILWTLYYIIGFTLFHKTLGTAFIGASITDSKCACMNQSKSYFQCRIILREIFTSFPSILLLLLWISPKSPFNLVADWHHLCRSALAVLVIGLIILTIKRQRVFKLKLAQDTEAKPKAFKKIRLKIAILYFVILIFAGFSRIMNTILTNPSITLQESLFKVTPEPSANSVHMYVDFLNNKKEKINDYVLHLLDQYDYIILCERMHPEMTQYDMIYNLITDERITQKVNTVFTEIGNIASVDDYSDLTKTTFPNEDSLDVALAKFMMKNQTVHLLWNNTNWFNFLKKIYYFNQNQANKVNIYFSDRDWVGRRDIKTGNVLDNRDSLMASNIIKKIHQDNIGKAIIIMNFRHAFLEGNNNCGYYIAQAFKEKATNILIHTETLKYLPLYTRINHGKWDAAFNQMQETEFAFNLSHSPFGKDKFDLFPYFSPNKCNTKKYEDMFKGVIYYQPLNNHYVSHGFPHIYDPENVVTIQQRAEKMKVPFKKDPSSTNKLDGYYIMNLIDNFIFILIYLTGIIISITLFFTFRKRMSISSTTYEK